MRCHVTKVVIQNGVLKHLVQIGSLFRCQLSFVELNGICALAHSSRWLLCPGASLPPLPVVQMHECSRGTSGFLVVR